MWDEGRLRRLRRNESNCAAAKKAESAANRGAVKRKGPCAIVGVAQRHARAELGPRPVDSHGAVSPQNYKQRSRRPDGLCPSPHLTPVESTP